jgi:hypothetical protein
VKAAWAALALVVLAVPACAPTVVATAGFGALQAGAESFINGELESAQFCSIETVRKASMEALQALQFKVISERHDERSASINAQELHGRSIRIKLSAKSPVVTKTNVRVGLMGDQVMSRLIMGEIQARCPAAPAADTPEEPKP